MAVSEPLHFSPNASSSSMGVCGKEDEVHDLYGCGHHAEQWRQVGGLVFCAYLHVEEKLGQREWI